ncbi:hypothetical protein STCU_10826 [Strigomonas culicis]|uniref:Uncharacterized protein n=1 Tax=Strigomonas culicis TaxID=28005 RepID=S9TL78_9TRYP|nr:hypothetical protein STCU_10826 [Strigomonas culicis]|eukprot:EPY17083.1 hypothetical protein STCU_10826 [Strigomonas culicis]
MSSSFEAKHSFSSSFSALHCPILINNKRLRRRTKKMKKKKSWKGCVVYGSGSRERKLYSPSPFTSTFFLITTFFSHLLFFF